jgi:Domain of unknown function (DUF6265)
MRVQMIGAWVMAFAVAAGSPAAGRQSKQKTLDGAGWLAGDWEMIVGTRCTEEHWTSSSSNMLVGMSRTVEAGRTISFEFIRIEARADGVFFVAQPGGRPPVDFRLASDPGPELVFLNPGHEDHLKRIIYRRHDADTMIARIEGADFGKRFAVDYPYKRALGRVGSNCGAK